MLDPLNSLSSLVNWIKTMNMVEERLISPLKKSTNRGKFLTNKSNFSQSFVSPKRVFPLFTGLDSQPIGKKGVVVEEMRERESVSKGGTTIEEGLMGEISRRNPRLSSIYEREQG